MSIHDDSDLDLLERDLQKLAQPRGSDAELHLALRGQLAKTWQARSPRRRPPRRVALGWSAVATAAATIALVVVVTTAGSGGPGVAQAAIVHHALTAVTPPANEILHEEVVGAQNGAAIAAEWWQQTSPPYASRGIKGSAGHQGEFGDNGTTSFMYDPTTNTIYEQSDSSRPTFTDPVSQVRNELARGQAQSVGTVVVGGATLYKIDLPGGLVGYFDPNTFQPRYLDDPQRDGSVVRLRVVAYEYLPMTSANQALLSVTAQHPTAHVEVGQGGQPGK
jgi:hypothetical protein